MNKKLKTILEVVIFIVVLCTAVAYSVRLVERKQSQAKNGAFFTEAKAGHIDGLFLGSSHVINGINPIQIYEEQGYTTFNLGGHGSTLPVSYWTLVNALDYCTPRFVFIDTYMIEKNYQYLDINVEGDDHDTKAAVDQLHAVFDCFPMSANKKAAIKDLISDDETQREFFWNFIKYHGRWNEITEDDYKVAGGEASAEQNHLMGAEMRYEVEPDTQKYPLLGADDMDETESIGKDYLRKMIELCLSKGITPVIIQVPFEESEDFQGAANSALKFAEEYQIPFVNARYVENIINNYSDLQSQTHLSAYGAYKVSQYFGENTLTQLGMTDHRGDAAYSVWDKDVLSWHQEIKDAAANPKDLQSLLMTLQFDDLSSAIFVNNGSTALLDEMTAKELSDLAGEELDAEALRSAAIGKQPVLIVRDSKDGKTVISMDSERIEDEETSIGLINFTAPVPEYNLLSIGEEKDVNVLNYDKNNKIDVQVIIYDNQSGEEMAHLYFDEAGIVQTQGEAS